MWRDRNACALLVEIPAGVATGETVSQKELSQKFLKRLNKEWPDDLAILVLGIYSEVLRAGGLNRCFYISVHSSVIRNGQKVETPKCPSTDKWIT